MRCSGIIATILLALTACESRVDLCDVDAGATPVPPPFEPAPLPPYDGGADAAPSTTCLPCPTVGRTVACPTDPRATTRCFREPDGSHCARFGPETCNGVDDDCNGFADDGSLCDDHIGCTLDSCEHSGDGAACYHVPSVTGISACNDGLSCTVDACDPDGTLLVPTDARDTVVVDPAPERRGCRHLMRSSWCQDTWDGCYCNGTHEECVAGGGEPTVGCKLQAAWRFPDGGVGSCTQEWPCADQGGHDCDNCWTTACCEPAGSTCNPAHRQPNAELRRRLDEACAGRNCTTTSGVTCPSFAGVSASRCDAYHDGNPCTFEAGCRGPVLGCAAPVPTPLSIDTRDETDADGHLVDCRGITAGSDGCGAQRCDGFGACVRVDRMYSDACDADVGCCVHRCEAGACILDCDTPECGMVH